MNAFKLFFVIVTISFFLITGCTDGTTFATDNSLSFTAQEDIDTDPGAGEDPDDGTVDLSVEIEARYRAYPVNGNIEYIVTIAESGPVFFSEHSVNISLPAGTTVVSISAASSWNCTDLGSTVTCIGILTFTAGDTIEINVTAPAVTGDITASVSGSSVLIEFDASDNSDSVLSSIGLSTAAIQTQIDAAIPGDTILVGPGIYVGCLDFAGKDVNLQSTGGAQNTSLYATACGSIVTIGPNGSIEGFNLAYFSIFGAADRGPGIEVSGSGTLISRNIFENNNADLEPNGTAIWGNIASPLIERNIFRNISCDSQVTSGSVTFVNASSPEIRNNVFENNRCRGINIDLPDGNFPVVINNTLVGNDVGLRIDQDVSHIYRNNIIVGNGIGVESVADVNNPVLENNLVFNNTTNYDGISDQTSLNGNISSDPLFVDIVGGNYQLQTGSPAIDSGSSVGAPADDFDGTARPLDGDGIATPDFDMGAFEAPTI